MHGNDCIGEALSGVREVARAAGLVDVFFRLPPSGQGFEWASRYEQRIGRPVSFTVEYKPPRVKRDGSLNHALETGDSKLILAAVRRLAEAAPDGCLLWNTGRR